MLFQELPDLGTSPYDNTQILVGSGAQLKRTGNLFDEVLDQEMIRLVLSKLSPNDLLNQHISDKTIHTRQDDTTVSPNTTWSSARVNSAISASNPWFNLDNIPEGATNKFFTDDRGRALIAATTQGIPVTDHRAIAAQIVSVLLNFNTTAFRYRRLVINPTAVPIIGVSVDGGPVTNNYFDVTPGVRNIALSGAGYNNAGAGETWICDELAHSISLNNGSQQITPRLTLDAFADGAVNRFWNTSNFANSTLVHNINQHVNTSGTVFNAYHARINDSASTGSNDATWSSNKIINYVSSELARNRQLASANTKSVMVAHETAFSGQNASGYSWDTAISGTIHTHHITRNPSSNAYNNASGGFISSTITLPPGTWLIYWEADMTLRSGLFTAVTSPSSYIALSTTPRVAVLTVPGSITNSTTGGVAYRLMSKFSTTTPYNSSFQNTWLQPQSIAGVNELYATVHIERVR